MLRDLHSSAHTALGLGRLALASELACEGLARDPANPGLGLIRAIVDHRLGRTAAAVDRLRKILAQNPPNATEVTIVLAEVLSRGGRREELEALLASRADWKSDERSVLFAARALARSDKATAIEQLTTCARSTKSTSLKRIAGFEAVRMLDAEARYREAFDLARELHQQTTPAFDILGVEIDTAEQLRMLGRTKPTRREGERNVTAKRHGERDRGLGREIAGDCTATSLVVGLPRSGTTLVEQMLDRHPLVAGIGEFEGISEIGDALVSRGLWPTKLHELTANDAMLLEREYIAGASTRMREGTTTTFDKTLRAWRLLPAVAVVLPEASLVHIERDAKDCAISMYLSNFHPHSFGFTASLEMIRRVMLAERRLVQPSFETLGLRAIRVQYETLVAHPEREITRVLEHIGVAFDARVLNPEENTRTVLTLSHEQVRRKINSSSIGRWKNYEFAFDASWDALARPIDDS